MLQYNSVGALSREATAELKSLRLTEQRLLIKKIDGIASTRSKSPINARTTSTASTRAARLRANQKVVRITEDYGASYFIDRHGGRFVSLIWFLKFLGDHGRFEFMALYNIASDPDERAEDAYYTRMVWVHHLRHSRNCWTVTPGMK